MDVAYVGTAKNGGFTDIDANASDVRRAVESTSRPFYPTVGTPDLAAALGAV